uniref:PHD finger protein ING1-like n=1 Tax=Rhizophora mucronata TaxID=61149 RepID=A0A2P2R2P8_RHIMU
MEPFYLAIRVVTSNHFSIANLVAKAVGWLIWIHWQIQLHTSRICRSWCCCCCRCHCCC